MKKKKSKELQRGWDYPFLYRFPLEECETVNSDREKQQKFHFHVARFFGRDPYNLSEIEGGLPHIAARQKPDFCYIQLPIGQQ
jgi:hypothetical protein